MAQNQSGAADKDIKSTSNNIHQPTSSLNLANTMQALGLDNRDNPFEYSDGQLQDPFTARLFPLLPTPTLLYLGTTCKAANAWAKDDIALRKKNTIENVSQLLHAVLQGDEDKAKTLLQTNPNLVLSKVGNAKDLLGREYKGYSPIQAAFCTGDDEMLKVIKAECADKIVDFDVLFQKQMKDIIPNGLEAHFKAQECDDNLFNFNDIYHAILSAPNHDIISALTLKGNKNSPINIALNRFRIAFEQRLQGELIFNPHHSLNAFKAYSEQFLSLGTWEKRECFWRLVVGYTQRLYSAPWLQAHARSIYDIVENANGLDKRSFTFKNGMMLNIYPFPKQGGLGYVFAVAGSGSALPCGPGNLTNPPKFKYLHQFIEHKKQSFTDLLKPETKYLNHP